MTSDIKSLIADLRSDDVAKRAAAAERLATMETEAGPAAIALVEACAVDDEAREAVVAALESLGPPPVADIVKLAALTARPELDVAYWAATLLGRLRAEAAPAVPQLAEVLAGHGEMAVRERAAWALGQIGPAATAARHALSQAAADTSPRLARLAREALEQVAK